MMQSIFKFAGAPLAIAAALTLSACVTEDYASELASPNFGRRALNSDENVDARQLTNGVYSTMPYALTPYAPGCSNIAYACSRGAGAAWSSFDP